MALVLITIRSYPYSALILGMFPLNQIAHVGVSPSRNLKLISREITFEVFQPVLKSYLNVTDRQTNRRADDLSTYCGITALCLASRAKNQA